MRKAIYILFVCLLSVALVSAQDIHFSQYYNAPLLLNPALTGKVHGKYRIGVNYRNQWIGIVNGNSTYSTPALSFDMPIRFKNKDILGVGFYIVNDHSSGGKLSNLTVMSSFAFHKALGVEKNHSISIGMQLGWVQKKLDLAVIKLGDQIDLQNEGFTGVSADNLSGSTSNFDLQGGFHWNSKFTDRVNIYAGFSMFHILEPKQSFAGYDLNVPRRHVVSSGADFGISNRLDLLPSFIYISQGNVNEFNIGLSLGINFTKESAMYFGGYYRTNDAIIPYFGLNIKGFGLGVSYDLTTSTLEKTTGGIELSLSYTGKYIAIPDISPSLYCPRF